MSSGSNATTRRRSPDGETDDGPYADQPRRIREFLAEPVREDLPTEQRVERLEALLGRYLRDEIHADGDGDAAGGDVAREELEELQARVDQLAGLAEGQESTPEKRALDLCIGLRNDADARETGAIQWDYNDVLQHWRRNGHGRLDPKQAYRAMERVAELDGFENTTDGGGTRVVTCTASDAPAASDVEAAFDNVNNGSDGTNAVGTGNTEVNTSASR